MKKVAVVGANGNMGRRYKLILEQYCECEVVPIEIDGYRDPSDCDGIIIATPTNTHYELIKFYHNFGKPILCEKPICKNPEQLKELMALPGIDLSMINQYEFMLEENENSDKRTTYNYYRTGNDGLLWDCINIIGNAVDSYDINNNSPVWLCKINGDIFDIKDMDYAYISNISEWKFGWRNKEYILTAHEKVWRAIDNATKA